MAPGRSREPIDRQRAARAAQTAARATSTVGGVDDRGARAERILGGARFVADELDRLAYRDPEDVTLDRLARVARSLVEQLEAERQP